MNRGAKIVTEAGQRELAGAGTAADLRSRLEDVDRESRTCKLDRAREPVRARADDDGAPRAQEAVRAARGSGNGVSTRSS
jgi:hypothetical protein